MAGPPPGGQVPVVTFTVPVAVGVVPKNVAFL